MTVGSLYAQPDKSQPMLEDGDVMEQLGEDNVDYVTVYTQV